MHRPLWDENGRLIKTSTDPSISPKITQEQLKQDLLCGDCEQKIGRWETYARDLMFRNASSPEVYENAMIFHGVDYKKFKLFQLSLLWRASVSSLTFFKNVDLSASPHQERIRSMLYNEEPGKSHEYGCLIIFPKDKNIRKIIDVIIEPDEFRFDTYRGYKFCLNGIYWHFITSSHTGRFLFKNAFLQEDGTLPLLPDFNFIKDEYEKLYRAHLVRISTHNLNK